MQEKDQRKLELALRNLRHLYEQMLVPGAIFDQKSAANGLLDGRTNANHDPDL
jgi:hypothetical protein